MDPSHNRIVLLVFCALVLLLPLVGMYAGFAVIDRHIVSSVTSSEVVKLSALTNQNPTVTFIRLDWSSAEHPCSQGGEEQ